MTRNFITITLIAFALMTAYNFSAFPCDNVCKSGTKVSSEYVGKFDLFDGEGAQVHASIGADDVSYFFCNQDFLRHRPFVFPPVPANQPEGEEWMNESQANIANFFGWIGFTVFVLGVVVLFYRVVFKPLRNFLFVTHKLSGNATNIKFSEVPEIFGYVPQMKLLAFPFPLILCDVRGINDDLIGWTDPRYPHDHHSVIFDVPGLVRKENERAENIDKNCSLLSVVKHWPPTK